MDGRINLLTFYYGWMMDGWMDGWMDELICLTSYSQLDVCFKE